MREVVCAHARLRASACASVHVCYHALTSQYAGLLSTSSAQTLWGAATAARQLLGRSAGASLGGTADGVALAAPAANLLPLRATGAAPDGSGGLRSQHERLPPTCSRSMHSCSGVMASVLTRSSASVPPSPS